MNGCMANRRLVRGGRKSITNYALRITKRDGDGRIAGESIPQVRRALNFEYSKPEADVWAAAATLYFLLTGAAPCNFSPTADSDVVVKTTSHTPHRERNHRLPRRLAAIFDTALRDDRELRFRSAREFRVARLSTVRMT